MLLFLNNKKRLTHCSFIGILAVILSAMIGTLMYVTRPKHQVRNIPPQEQIQNFQNAENRIEIFDIETIEKREQNDNLQWIPKFHKPKPKPIPSQNPNNPSNLLTSHNVTNNNSRRPSNVPIPASNMMSPEDQITSANGRHSTMMPVESINDVGVGVGARNSNFGGHPASISKFGNSEINYIPNHSYHNNNNNNEAHAEIQDIYMREKSQESEKCLLCSKSMCVLMVVGVLILTGVIIFAWFVTYSHSGTRNNGNGCVQDFMTNSFCKNDGPSIYRGVDRK